MFCVLIVSRRLRQQQSRKTGKVMEMLLEEWQLKGLGGS